MDAQNSACPPKREEPRLRRGSRTGQDRCGASAVRSGAAPHDIGVCDPVPKVVAHHGEPLPARDLEAARLKADLENVRAHDAANDRERAHHAASIIWSSPSSAVIAL